MHYRQTAGRPAAHRRSQRRHRACHGRLDGPGGFTLHHPDTAAMGEEKIHLQTLLVAEMVELFAPALVHLALENFRRDEAFEQSPKERRALEFRPGCQAQQIARQARITQIDFRRLDQSFSEILKIGWNENDLTRYLENMQPVGYGRDGDPKRSRQVCAVENLTVATGQQR